MVNHDYTMKFPLQKTLNDRVWGPSGWTNAPTGCEEGGTLRLFRNRCSDGWDPSGPRSTSFFTRLFVYILHSILYNKPVKAKYFPEFCESL